MAQDTGCGTQDVSGSIFGIFCDEGFLASRAKDFQRSVSETVDRSGVGRRMSIRKLFGLHSHGSKNMHTV